MKTFIICWCFLFNFVSITKVQKNSTSSFVNIPTITLKASLFVGEAQAQADTLTLSAKKSQHADLAQYYLPMLVMLGIGIISIYLMLNLKKKSADFYIFLVGAVIYLLSVITGWKDEKAKFAELPEEVSKNTQVSALKAQRDALEEVLKMVEKRLMLQGAATAAFLASAITAGVFYAKEKAAQAKLTAAHAKMAAELSVKCLKHPQINPPGAISLLYTNHKPTLAHCKEVVARSIVCMKGINSDHLQLFNIDETLRSDVGSAAMSGDQQALTKSAQALGKACFDASWADIPESDNEISYTTAYNDFNESLIKEDLKRYYVEKGVDLSTAKELVVITDNKESVATKIVVRLLNELVSEAKANGVVKAIGNTITRKGGETVGQAANKATSTAITTQADTPNQAFEMFVDDNTRNRAVEMCSKGRQCSDADMDRYIALAQEQSDVVQANVAYAANAGLTKATSAGISKAGNALARQGGNLLRASGNIGTNAARSTAASKLASSGAVKRTLTRVAAGTVVRVVAAGVAASAAAPVVVAGATLAVGAYSAYTLGKATYDYVIAHDKVAKARRAELEAAGKCRDTRRGRRCRGDLKLEQLLQKQDFNAPKAIAENENIKHPLISFITNLFIKKAHAFPLATIVPGVSSGALDIADQIIEEADAEADMWFFNPKGRMIFYSAITAITALIALNTNRMKKRLKSDINEIQTLIDNYDSMSSNNESLESRETLMNDSSSSPSQESTEEVNDNQSSFRSSKPQKEKFSLLSLFINSAQAAKKPVVGVLPFSIPCMTPYRGKCISATTFMANRTRGIRFSPVTRKAVITAARMGNMIQRRNYVSQDFMNEAKVLNSLKPGLEKTFEYSKQIINRKKTSQYREKPIPFEKLEASLTQRFMNIGKKAMAKAENPSIFSSLFGVGSFNDLDVPVKEPSNDDLSDDYTLALNEQAPIAQMKSDGFETEEEAPNKKLNFSESSFGINKSKEDSLFHQISKRYLIWQTRP